MASENVDYLLVALVEGFLGSPKNSRTSQNRVQWQFNCPSEKCRRDHNKFNLEFKSDSQIFKCWKCSYSGFIYRLVRDYGSKEDLKRLKLILPEYAPLLNVFKKPHINHDLVTCDLPKGYLPLNQERKNSLYEHAWTYATVDRRISPAQIDKLKIGYTETGPRKFRLIIPSFNVLGRVNYYEARAYLKDAKVPYLKPDYPDRNDIIFNEQYINWDLPIYIVEGVFDAIRLPNAIPMLGKTPSDLLLNKILKHNSTVVVCLDSDAFKDAVKIYKSLASLGINVYFIDLKGKKDISKIYEDGGQEALSEVLKTIRRIDTLFEINRIINE